jgi:ribosomal protein L37AE/L43A
MRKAGLEPRTCMEWPGARSAQQARGARSGRRYSHTCPVCQSRRVAGRPVRGWRCARCVEAGLLGNLTIRRIA